MSALRTGGVRVVSWASLDTALRALRAAERGLRAAKDERRALKRSLSRPALTGAPRKEATAKLKALEARIEKLTRDVAQRTRAAAL